MKTKATLKLFALIPLLLSLTVLLSLFWAKPEMKASREMARASDQIVENAFELNLITDQYLLYPGERPKTQFRSIHQAMKGVLEAIKTKTDEEKGLLKTMRENYESLGTLFDLLVSLQERPAKDQPEELHETVVGQLLISSREIVSTSFRLSRISLGKMEAVQEGTILLLLIVALISGIGLALLSFLMGRRIERTNEDLHLEISEHRQTEEALRESKEKFRVTLSSIGDAVIAADVSGRVTFLNSVAEGLTGWSSEEATGQPIRSVFQTINERTRQPAENIVEHVLRQGGIVSLANHTVLITRDGREIPVEDSAAPIKDDAGNISGVVLVFHDVAEKRRAQEALRQRTLELEHLTETQEERVKERTAELENLSSRLVSAQEDERRRVSYDLHDHVWQALVAIRFELERLFSGREGMDRAALQKKSKEIMANLLEAVGKIRSMQGDLWPYVLDDIGLLATIDWYCREFEKNHPGLTMVRQDGFVENEIPSSTKIVIYRILQEALSNVAKHSRAGRVTLRLLKKDQRMEFTVEDNGLGFDPEEVLIKSSPWGGLGLLNIKARTELSGGLLGIESVAGQGTTVRASWPFHENV